MMMMMMRVKAKEDVKVENVNTYSVASSHKGCVASMKTI